MTVKNQYLSRLQGGSTCQNDNNLSQFLEVGQHPRIIQLKFNRLIGLGVGQHPRIVGQHKTEWWVNMLQNLH